MAMLDAISSNIVGLAFAEESALKTLTAPTFWGLQPNSFNDFGANLTLLARAPITSSRRRLKGVITDLEAGGGFNIDLTQNNLQLLLQGFFFADLRRHAEDPITDITGTNTFKGTGLGSTRYPNGTLLRSSGFAADSNNSLTGYHIVTGTTSTTDVTCSGSTLTNATGQTGQIVAVGWKPPNTSNMAVVAVGPDGLPTITSTSGAFVNLGLKAGEWIYIGGDSSALKFAEATNNGWKRIRKVAAGTLTIDKSANGAMVDEPASGSLTPTIFFGRMLKDEAGTLVKRRTYHLERSLGAPDTDHPEQIQSEYLTGAVPNKCEFSINTASKIVADLSFVAADFETRTAATGLKAATVDNRLYDSGADAFNTSSDVTRINLSVVSLTDVMTPLFAFVTDFKLSIDNGITPEKAVGTLGAFELSEGDFVVGGSLTAYFSTVTGVAAVRANSDVTMDFCIVKDNAGIVVDIPLLALGDGRLNVEKDKKITLPLSLQAASGAAVHANLDHTLAMFFFDYLPDAASA